MSAPLRHPVDGHKLDGQAIDTDKLAENFAGYCAIRAGYVADGTLPMQLAADELQAVAKFTGLSRRKGWDFVQAIMSAAFAHIEMVPDDMPDELRKACEQKIMLRAADLVKQWELADPRDRWRHTGEAPPAPEIVPIPKKQYRTPESTIQAFFWQARQDDPEALARWLDQHPRDEKFLCKLWKAKNAAEA